MTTAIIVTNCGESLNFFLCKVYDRLTIVIPIYTNMLRLSSMSITSDRCASSVSSLNQSSHVNEFPAIKQAKRSSLPMSPTEPMRKNCALKHLISIYIYLHSPWELTARAIANTRNDSLSIHSLQKQLSTVLIIPCAASCTFFRQTLAFFLPHSQQWTPQE